MGEWGSGGVGESVGEWRSGGIGDNLPFKSSTGLHMIGHMYQERLGKSLRKYSNKILRKYSYDFKYYIPHSFQKSFIFLSETYI